MSYLSGIGRCRLPTGSWHWIRTLVCAMLNGSYGHYHR